jgi:outer membrane protein assembly factor BamB
LAIHQSAPPNNYRRTTSSTGRHLAFLDIGNAETVSLLFHATNSPEKFNVTVEDLIFVGLNGYAVALNRNTGEIVWSNDQMKSGYVTLLLDFDRLIVSTNGYIYCLDPLTGNIQWHNPLKGYGVGAPTSLVSVRGQTSQTVIEQAAAAAAAAATASHGATS